MKYKILYSLLILVSLFASCAKDSPSPERRILDTGQAEFWMKSPPNTAGDTYNTYITIYNSNGSICVPRTSYSTTCTTTDPGCNGSGAATISLQDGSYYAIIEFSSGSINSPFIITAGGCTELYTW